MVNLTPEQLAPLASSGRKKVVKALAGTGKSTLLRERAIQNPGMRFLYIVFNADNAKEAKASFPRNVTALTWHGLAHRHVGKAYVHKYNQILSLKAIKEVLQVADWKLVAAIRDSVSAFSNSVDFVIGPQHIPQDVEITISAERFVSLAQQLWGLMSDHQNNFPCTHDTYAKVWALSSPILSEDEIMFDEGQDSNSLIMDVLAKQSASLIIVGDDNQQIYRFRKAVNSLGHYFLRDAEWFPLTQSFRFGPEIAKLANVLLCLVGEHLRMRGLESIQSAVRCEPINYDPSPDGKQKAFISRTVMGTIECALAVVDKGQKIYWAGGIGNYRLDDLVDNYHLKRGAREMIKSQSLLKNYSDYDDYFQQAEAAGDSEMIRTVNIVETYGDRLPELISKLKNVSTNNLRAAVFVVSTAHRSKGMEFPICYLNEDFKNPLSVLNFRRARQGGILTQDDVETYVEEMNLLYVASTRAILELYINTAIAEIISHVKTLLSKANYELSDRVN